MGHGCREGGRGGSWEEWNRHTDPNRLASCKWLYHETDDEDDNECRHHKEGIPPGHIREWMGRGIKCEDETVSPTIFLGSITRMDRSYRGLPSVIIGHLECQVYRGQEREYSRPFFQGIQ